MKNKRDIEKTTNMERITKRDLDELDFKILSADNSDIKKYKEELDKISNLIRIRIN